MATILKGDRISLPTASSNPSSPSTGDTYFNSTDKALNIYDGTKWGAVTFAPLGSQTNPATNAAAILADDPTSSNGYYYITLNNVATEVYCDMTTSGGGWMMLWSAPYASLNAAQIFSASGSGANVGSEFNHFSLSYAQRSAVNAACSQSESLVKHSSTAWMKINKYIWNSSTHTSGNYRFEQNIDIVTANGTTDNTAEYGLTNYGQGSGGDFGIANNDNGLDHHNTSAYYNLNQGCGSSYVYQYSYGYKVNTGLSGWLSANASCASTNQNYMNIAVYMR